MEFSSVTQTAFLSASILSMILAASLTYQATKKRLHWSMAAAALMQTIWLASIALKSSMSVNYLGTLLITESLHYSFWLFALTKTTERFCANCLPVSYKVALFFVCIVSISLYTYNYFTRAFIRYEATLIIAQGILFSIVCLLSLEQLYRNINFYRLIKLLCLGLSIVFVFDAYLFSQHLIFSELDPNLWQARAAVSMAASTLMIIGVATFIQPIQQSAKLTFSRPIIFYTTSLTIAGALLTTLSIGGYYVRSYGGNWGTVIYTLILMAGLIFLAFVFTSDKLRKRISVLINKHLFSYKYDYRSEWLKLINQLSIPANASDASVRAIKVSADLFKCEGGALWLKRSNILVPVCQINTNIDVSGTSESSSSPFYKALKQEWVFAPNSPNNDLAYNNSILPQWINRIDNIWLLFPLLTEDDLIGFMLLTYSKDYMPISWEDLDLTKTVGRQVASYLTRHEQAELLAQSRQFDAFNKLSAFVMHDLKNLIAQQSLVVKNAEKHKDNPAFVEDAINTIKNSVDRMHNLLRKLQHTEPEQTKIHALKDVFIEAVKRCHRMQPIPTLVPLKSDIRVKADFDSLVMVFTHIIQNAQDATPNNGFVDIGAIEEEQTAFITIEDNGCGMSDDFIANKLFRPFESTKAGKGMGVGVYQAREYIDSLSGNIRVESTQEEGTTFIIMLPTASIEIAMPLQ
ncbi:MAG: PEP-CTERM system histidine kinase PrsK [Alteromonadaceae bacterium]|nr:MAG: PEP-CTERM system histidine kinase PrsK [Alteromonadaceae bacterium]